MKKRIIIASIVILMALPLGLIAYISYLEMEEYKPDVSYTIGEGAYGELQEVIRGEIEEALTLEGTITSREYTFVDVNNKSYGMIKTVVNIGDEVKKGDILLYIKDKSVVSSVDGIVEEINVTGENGYVKLLNLSNVIFVSYSNDIAKLEIGKEYSIGEGVKATLISLSNTSDEKGRKGYFSIVGDHFIYGETKELKVKTGVKHADVLMVNKDCVYQKEKDGPYYIRRVGDSGKPIGEVEVKIGIEGGEYITVSGVEEGWLCDSGYGKFIKSSLDGDL